MKKIVYGVLAAVVVLFVSCYEVNEEIVISENGSGTYVTKMDMGGMLQMIQSMAGEEELAKNGLDRNIDTLINLKDILDTAKDVTPEQKRLFKDGSMKLQMNIKESLFKTDIKFPFKTYGDLQTLMSGSGMTGMGETFKKIFAGPDSGRVAGPSQENSMEQINTVYDVTVNKNRISRKVNKEKYDELMKKPELAQAKQMMGSFEILMTTTIKLPRPVKKSDNEMITLSADKKTVTMKYDLLKLIDAPEKYSYTIDY